MDIALKSEDEAQEMKMIERNDKPIIVATSKKKIRKYGEKRFWHINKNTLPFKLHFFLYIGAMGALIPFRPSIGITRLALGAGNLAMVFTTQQFLFIVFKPLIGYFTDYFNSLKAMIVILTGLNLVFSYLLLVIPSAGDIEVSLLNVSFPQHTSDETNFCHWCRDPNELQKMIELLPKFNDTLERGNSCGEKDFAQQVFNCHSMINQSSSTSLNRTYKIIIETCLVIPETAVEEPGTSLETLSPNNFDYTMYMTVFHNQLPQFSIVCPKIKNASKVENIVLTPSFILMSCYMIPEHHLNAVSTETEKNILCNGTFFPEKYDLESFRKDSYKTYQFWMYTVLIILSCACTSTIFTLSDTACYERIQETGAEYGKQRAWGAVGWGIIAPFAGFLNDYTDSYLAAMILMTVLCALQIWNLCKMDLAKPQNSQNILKDIRTVLGSAEFVAFSVGVFFNGMGIAMVWYFLPWFITDIGGNRLLIGMAHTVQCFLGEVPFMILSGCLIRKIGHFNVVSLALLCHCLRFLAYSSLKNPWHILPIECLDGITFGAFYAAMTSYGKLNSKPGTEATTQALLCSTCEGLGAGLGCVIAGVCIDQYGGYRTFFYGGLCFGVAATINITSTVLLKLRKS